MAPSVRRIKPGNRASNLAVFSLSKTFKQTTRPRLRSRARQTFDMLPCPVRPSSSKRLLMSTLGILLRGLTENSLLKNPTEFILVFAIIDDPGHLGPQILARDDPIDEAVLQQELTGLETRGQLQANGMPGRAPASEADGGAGCGSGGGTLYRQTRWE